MRPIRGGRFAFVATALLLMGADDAVRKIESGGVTFEVPRAWKSDKPSSKMRLAQIKIAAEEGDDDPAELVLFAFPGGGGTVEANLDRWEKQFQGKGGDPAKIKTDDRKGKNVDVTFAEITGRYVAAVTPGGSEKFDKPDWHLLGAIVQTADTGYYFKLVGPEKTVAKAKPGFEAMVKSIAVAKE